MRGTSAFNTAATEGEYVVLVRWEGVDEVWCTMESVIRILADLHALETEKLHRFNRLLPCEDYRREV